MMSLGCGDGGREDSDPMIETGPVTATATTTDTSGSPATSSTTSTGATSMTGPQGTTSGDEPSTGDAPQPLFDLGAWSDVPELKDGCSGIDFLFAIDNSGSMGVQQTQLLASFDGFIAGIQNSLTDVDSFHVGVVTSDDYFSNQRGCQTLGDLVTQTPAGGTCGPFADGNRFLTDADDIQTEFPCVGEIGTSGSGLEMPVSAAIAALSPEKATPGACNEGFVREDAILVIIVVTDDPPIAQAADDAQPSLDTSAWAPAVLAAKNNDPEAVVVIGFIPWQDVSCVYNNDESPNLINFVDAFGEQGIKASICEPDYGPVFTSTLETIKTTCDNFVPQG